MLPLQNTVVLQWIIFGITLAIGILGLVAQFMQAGNFTLPAILSLAVAVLMFVLTQVTKSDQAKAIAEMKRLSGKK